jgi:hypothetical protein
MFVAGTSCGGGRPGPRREEHGDAQRSWASAGSTTTSEGLEDRGRGEEQAEEILLAVNKERARAGESEQASRTSTKDISSGRRGGKRSHQGAGGRTRDQLYEEAKRKGVEGRSKMSKAELEKAVGR